MHSPVPVNDDGEDHHEEEDFELNMHLPVPDDGEDNHEEEDSEQSQTESQPLKKAKREPFVVVLSFTSWFSSFQLILALILQFILGRLHQSI